MQIGVVPRWSGGKTKSTHTYIKLTKKAHHSTFDYEGWCLNCGEGGTRWEMVEACMRICPNASLGVTS